MLKVSFTPRLHDRDRGQAPPSAAAAAPAPAPRRLHSPRLGPARLVRLRLLSRGRSRGSRRRCARHGRREAQGRCQD